MVHHGPPWFPGFCGAAALRHGGLAGGVHGHHALLLRALPRRRDARRAGRNMARGIAMVNMVGFFNFSLKDGDVSWIFMGNLEEW